MVLVNVVHNGEILEVIDNQHYALATIDAISRSYKDTGYNVKLHFQYIPEIKSTGYEKARGRDKIGAGENEQEWLY